ncbi:MAG TPA: NAD(P)-dependent alcohol dehydrogenase [Cyclobacteriaceae bacterium]|nr:NAD(P)-dependent alcohol dehydrogenase [Cyclobacteriaceae bacterium]
MKAIITSKYGPPEILRLEEVEKPVPQDDEILIKIHAASLNAFDWHLQTADIFLVRFMGGGFTKPKNKIPGADIAGTIEAVGVNVKLFKPGDEIYGDLGSYNCGGFAEYVCARETMIARKPSNLSFEDASAVPMAAITALQGLRDYGQIKPGQKVLINGASGGVGTYAVQIAKVFGAEVTAVCSTAKMEIARSIGSDRVIDYTREDFTKSGLSYDLIFAANGYHPILNYKRSLGPGGRYVMAGGKASHMFEALVLGPFVSMTGNRKMGVVSASINTKDLDYIRELIEAGRIKPVIDKRFPLEKLPEALRYLGDGHAAGKVVINI